MLVGLCHSKRAAASKTLQMTTASCASSSTDAHHLAMSDHREGLTGYLCRNTVTPFMSGTCLGHTNRAQPKAADFFGPLASSPEGSSDLLLDAGVPAEQNSIEKILADLHAILSEIAFGDTPSRQLVTAAPSGPSSSAAQRAAEPADRNARHAMSANGTHDPKRYGGSVLTPTENRATDHYGR